MSTRQTLRAAALLLAALSFTLSSCVSVPARNPVPEAYVETAAIPGIPHARMWGDELPVDIEERGQLIRRQILEHGGQEELRRAHTFLSISGGGLNGAFGAGLLKGWTEAGDRPEFWIVTGVSTGAMIAPFAFLGTEYDDELESLYTSLATKDIVRMRGLIAGLTSDAMGDTEPLRKLLRGIIDEEMIEAIAAEHQRGRRLLIGTTNLDARRAVIWNIGAIASHGTPEAATLIRDLMLASAAIPGAFPPVRITVKANGELFDELHVDGGTGSQVFLYPAALDLRTTATALGITGSRSIYVIRNGFLDAQWSPVKPKVMEIAKAAIATLIRTQGLGDLYRIYIGAQRDELDYHLAYIPVEFDEEPTEEFDPVYMRELFDLGYEMASEGYPWAKSPPGIVAE